MNSDIAIRAEGLGKKYLIGHQSADRGTTFREAMAQGTRNLARMGRDMLRGRALIAGDAVEEFWALRDVNFEVKPGEVVGVVGRNGAGKSTLLKVLSRITEPSSGRVAINGRVASLLEVGTGFHPELTGRENIYLNGAILGMTRNEIRRKFDEIVEFSGVEKFLDTPVKRYSSGMFVRLAFAVAAHLEPEILIVDEVLAVGDAEFQKKCLGKMQTVAGSGRTVLFVSHDQSAILALCTRCILFAGGQIQATGSPSECISLYNQRQQSDGALLYASRQGRQDIRITSAKVAFDDFEATGGCLVVEISISPRSKGAVASRVTEVGLSIWKPDGTKIVSISTSHTLASVPSTNEQVALCRIPSIPLVAGTYNVNVFVNSEHGLEDYVLSAAQFSLGPGNVFATGKSVDPNWGLIAIPHSWGFRSKIND